MAKEISLVILGLFAFLLLILGLNAFGLFQKDIFGVWNANIDRKIFENNKSHIHGTIQNLNDLKLQYQTAEEGHRLPLREAILHEYSVFKNKNQVPDNIKRFIESLD